LRVGLYARVSKEDRRDDKAPTTESQLENQLVPLREYCAAKGWRIVREYAEFASAMDMKRRTQWRSLLEDAHEGRIDTIVCWKLDRCFRSMLNAAITLDTLAKQDVALVSITETWCDGTTAQGRFGRGIMIAFAELERENIRERTRAGLRRARAQGHRSGPRPKINGELDALRPEILAGVLSQREAARRLGVSARTVARALRHKGGPNGPALGHVNQGFADAGGGE
jgi:putative DNA-invertase from lambdoid prophage Rac